MRHALWLTAIVTGLFAAEVAAQGIPKQEAKLAPSDGGPGSFGKTVAISGDTAVVGDRAGSAYVFVRSGTVWSQQAKLAPSTSTTPAYGFAVAVSGNTAVVSDPQQSGISFIGPGALYVFVRHGTAWTQQATLVASDSQTGAFLGTALSISGDTVVAGRLTGSVSIPTAAFVFVRTGTLWSEQATLSPSLGVGEAVAVSGETAVVGAASQSKAFVFVRSGTSWSQQGVLATANNEQLGRSVAISGDTVVAGAGDAAYVFRRAGTSWSQQAQLLGPLGSGDFGHSVAVSDYDNILFVGASDTNVDGHSHAGRAYGYVRSGSTWTQQGTLTASDPHDNDGNGFAVAVSGDTAVTGTWEAGAAYVYDPIQPFNKLGGGLAGVADVPVLEGAGTLDPGTAGSLTLNNAAPFALSELFVSLANTPTPFKGGVLSTIPIAFQLSVGTFFTGSWTLPWSAWPSGIPSGALLYFQVAVSDATALKGVAISNLLRATQP